MAEVLKIQEVKLDLKRVTAQPQSIQPLKIGDNGNVFVVELTDNGVPVDLTGTRVLAVFSRGDGKTAQQDVENGVEITGNTITIRLRTGSFTDGQNNCEIQVYSGENRETLVTSARFSFDGARGIVNDDTVEAEDAFPVLVSLIKEVEIANGQAQDAVEAAADAVRRADEAIEKAETISKLARYTFNNVIVAAESFANDMKDADFPYRAAVALNGIEEKMVPEVNFSKKDSSMGIFALTAEAFDGGIYLYASEVPQEDIVIPTILVWV